MSLALFFGVLVLLLVLTVPICVSFAFVTLLPSIVDASFPYTADAAVRSMVSGLNNFPLLAIPLFIIENARIKVITNIIDDGIRKSRQVFTDVSSIGKVSP